jgi:hypothetical protein
MTTPPCCGTLHNHAITGGICVRCHEPWADIVRRSYRESLAPADAEYLARLINGLVEAGEMLLRNVQRIDYDPAPSNYARECWRESREAVSAKDPDR